MAHRKYSVDSFRARRSEAWSSGTLCKERGKSEDRVVQKKVHISITRTTLQRTINRHVQKCRSHERKQSGAAAAASTVGVKKNDGSDAATRRCCSSAIDQRSTSGVAGCIFFWRVRRAPYTLDYEQKQATARAGTTRSFSAYVSKSFVQLHFEPLCRLSDVLVPLAPPVHIFRNIRFVHHEDSLTFLYLAPKDDDKQEGGHAGSTPVEM